MTDRRELPDFIAPMLAKLGEPFDSDEHVFEIKWDGFRAILLSEGDGYRLRSRRDVDLRPRYPELAALARVPAGTVLDGEIVAMTGEGRPDFDAMLAHATPVTFVAFDLLWADWQDVMQEPLRARQARLGELCAAVGEPRLLFSDGVVGAGRELYAQAQAQGLEGIVAKRLDSIYRPGQRTTDWIKIKTRVRAHCAVIGFVPSGPRDFKSLIVASDHGGTLRVVGRVGSGIDDATRARLNRLLRARPRNDPLVPCPFDGEWIEPGIYCTVSYLELTAAGMLRAPVFEELLVDEGR